MKPFEVKDCALLLRMSGLSPAINLRELRQRIANCTEGVLYHHFCETTLRPSFDDPTYRNDLAVWANLHLRDQVLAERLGLLDPYGFASLEELRAATLEILDDRLSETPVVPWAAAGHEFFFMEALTVAVDTGVRVAGPADLAAAVREMTSGSVYFHFLEARRRPPIGEDDFTAWFMSDPGATAPYRAALAHIDFYFRSLTRLRDTIVAALEAVGVRP